MAYSFRIFLPKFIPQNVFFRGFLRQLESFTFDIFVTKYSTNQSDVLQRDSDDKNIVYGQQGGHHSKILLSNGNYMRIEQGSLVIKLVVNHCEIINLENCIIMLYDFDTVKNSQIISEYVDCEYFSKLHHLICMEYDKRSPEVSENICLPLIKASSWLSSSMFIQHLFSFIGTLQYLYKTLEKEKKIPIKQANLIFAIVVDVILGYLILELLTQDKKVLSALLMGSLERLVNSLHLLLKWLMGSPAGLKLNNAFNKMLGRYFSYHIQLWWLFLDVSGEKLDIVIHTFQYLGYLGLTFQAALVCDIICIATFHSYCIYVYAARLFNIQISGLIALTRLFVGRKFNPLRGGIDSCEYTNQELFVGTVAFTIMLLLLPTTAMYYIVFTLFRLLSLLVQYSLAKLIHVVQTMPLYVFILWLSRSPKIAGNILIEVISERAAGPLVLEVKLLPKPLHDLIKYFRPSVSILKPVEWTNLLSNVLTGDEAN